MVVSYIKILQKMKNKSQLSIEKDSTRYKKWIFVVNIWNGIISFLMKVQYIRWAQLSVLSKVLKRLIFWEGVRFINIDVNSIVRSFLSEAWLLVTFFIFHRLSVLVLSLIHLIFPLIFHLDWGITIFKQNRVFLRINHQVNVTQKHFLYTKEQFLQSW